MGTSRRRVSLVDPTLSGIEFIACNMRSADEREIYGLMPFNNPFLLAKHTLASMERGFGVMALLGERPVAVLGFTELTPRVLTAWAYATDEFPRVAFHLTRFVLKSLRPALLASPAHRLQADSRFDHVEAHNWLRVLGFRVEGRVHQLGKDGADYIRFYQLKEWYNDVHSPKDAEAEVSAAAAQKAGQHG